LKNILRIERSPGRNVKCEMWKCGDVEFVIHVKCLLNEIFTNLY
jgi:hypothetical protein